LTTPRNSAASERAERLLSLLPDNFRRILELRFLRGYSVREAANELGVTESNARVLQFRALRKAADLELEVLR
jgi:RNA polymerase sigma factor (sigma-70 family)